MFENIDLFVISTCVRKNQVYIIIMRLLFMIWNRQKKIHKAKNNLLFGIYLNSFLLNIPVEDWRREGYPRNSDETRDQLESERKTIFTSYVFFLYVDKY